MSATIPTVETTSMGYLPENAGCELAPAVDAGRDAAGDSDREPLLPEEFPDGWQPHSRIAIASRREILIEVPEKSSVAIETKRP